MFSRVEKMIAFRYLRSKRKESFISIIAAFSLIGIALGVATLIVVMAVMNGFRTEITNKILGITGHINIYSYERQLNNYKELSERIAVVPGVTSAVPVIEGQVMANTEFGNAGAIIKGIQKEELIKKHIISTNIKNGSLEQFKGKNHIVIGKPLAYALGVSAGDKVTLISPQGNATALGTIPRLKRYTIAAIFEAGMYEYDNSIVFMPLEAAQVFFKLKNSANLIEITTSNPHNSHIISDEIASLTEHQYQVRDWQLTNASLFNALKVERNVMFLILTLIVLIAAFNIISSLIMLVNDKKKDIAILRTMGASRASITRIFFICGSSIGVSGTFLGFILGISFALNIETIRQWLESLIGNKLFDPMIYFLTELPAEVRADDVIQVLTMALILSFLATIHPALKAAKEDPAEALRYE